MSAAALSCKLHLIINQAELEQAKGANLPSTGTMWWYDGGVEAAAAGEAARVPAAVQGLYDIALPLCQPCSMLNKRLADTDYTGYLGSAFLLSTVLIFKNWLGEGKPGAALKLQRAVLPWAQLEALQCA